MKSSGEAESKKNLDSLPLRHTAAKYLRQIPSQATVPKDCMPSAVQGENQMGGIHVEQFLKPVHPIIFLVPAFELIMSFLLCAAFFLRLTGA